MLQCLLATESLSTYFRNQHWKTEVNADNPLGMAGKMAAAYAGLNDDVSSCNPLSCLSFVCLVCLSGAAHTAESTLVNLFLFLFVKRVRGFG